MAFRIEPAEPPLREIERVGTGQLSRLETALTTGLAEAEDVHGARKSLKRFRSLLRLARVIIGKDPYHTLNVRARDMGRRLADSRDRHVMMVTLDKVVSETVGLPPRAVDEMRERLSSAKIDAPAADTAAVVRKTLGELHVLRREWERTLDGRLAGSGADEAREAMVRGLVRTYSRARDALAVVRSSEDPETFHELRKAVQHHGRHMTLLAPAWPAHFRARGRAARQLAILLGEDHDLAVLRHRLHAARSDAPKRAERSFVALDGSAAERQVRLRAMALPLAERLLAGSTKAVARETLAILEAARSAAASAHALQGDGEIR